MSDVPTYGKADNPFPETPQAATLYSVAWSGGSVSWQTLYLSTGSPEIADTSRLNRGPTGNESDDTSLGTASFWVRVKESEDASFQIVVVPQTLPATLPQFPPQAIFHIVMQKPTFIGTDAIPGWGLIIDNTNPSGTVGFQATSVQIGDIVEHWAHILVNWDFAVPAAELWVNGISRSLPLYQTGGDTTALWGTGGEINFLSTFFFLEEYSLGVQDVWIDNKIRISDPAKFFKAATGTPLPLGEHGELPLGRPPLFFFHGKPEQFVRNRGTGGAVVLIGDAPVSGSSPKVPL